VQKLLTPCAKSDLAGLGGCDPPTPFNPRQNPYGYRWVYFIHSL
jgi:hypothetical protein